MRAGLVASGEGHRGNPRVADEPGHRLGDVRLGDEQAGEETHGQSGHREDVLHCDGAAAHVGRVLEEPCVPGRECRGGEPEDLPEREVPRHDRQDDAQRLIAGPAAGPGRRNGLVGQCLWALLGVVLADPGALLDLGQGLGDRLAHLRHHQVGQRLLALAQPGGRVQEHRATVLDVRAGPVRLGRRGGVQELLDLRAGHAVVAGELGARGRVDGDDLFSHDGPASRGLGSCPTGSRRPSQRGRRRRS